MSHAVETMAWAHEVPWHGLGNRVEGDITVDDMLVSAGLDWTVDPYALYADIDGNKVKSGRNMLVRSTDKKVLTITGSNWKPLQNKNALEFFREYTESGGATLETAGSLHGGKIIWGLARVAAGFTLNGNDHVKGYILLVSPHECGKSITIRTTSIRVVCANTLAMAGGVTGKGAEYRQSHVKDFNTDAAKATVELVKNQIERMRINAEALNSLKMSEYDSVRFLAKFFQNDFPEKATAAEEKAAVMALINEPDSQSPEMIGTLWAMNKAPGAVQGTAWGLLNGVTYYTDHMAGRSNDTRLFNSWLGKTATLKNDVMNSLLEMV